MKTLLPKWSYLVLVAVGVVSGIFYYALPPALEGWRGFALNLASEVVGILITVLFIDAVLQRREEREQRRYRSVALQQLRLPLKQHLLLLFAIYKASVEQKPEREISRVEDLFSDDYRTQLTRFDFASEGPMVLIGVGGNQKVPWFDYLYKEVGKFKDDLNRIVDKYAFYLDPDTLNSAEQLINSSFVNIISYGPTIVTNARNTGHQGGMRIFAGDGMSTVIREHTDTFTKLVQICNKEASSENKIRVESHMWRNDTAPLIGSARVP